MTQVQVEPSSRESTAPRTERLRRRLPSTVLVIAALAQGATMLWLARDTWFGHDAWHYLTRRGTIEGADVGLFEPWGGHWQTTVVLIYRGMFAVFGMSSYLWYVGLAILLHLGVVLTLYRVLRLSGAGAWVAVGASWLVLFFGGGAEVYVNDGPIPLTLALLLSLTAYAMSLTGDLDRRRTVIMSLLLVAAIATSGVGLIGIVLVALATSLRLGLIRGVAPVIPAGVVFAIWYLSLGEDSGRVRVHGWDYARIPDFVWTGLTSSLESASAIPGSGGIILIGLVLGVALARDVPDALRNLGWAGLVAAIAQMSLSSLASGHLGLQGASQPRYQYLALVLMTPAAAVLLTALVRAARRVSATSRTALPMPALLGVVLVAAYTANGLADARQYAMLDSALTNVYRTWAYGTEAAVLDGEKVLSPHPDVLFSEDVDVRLMTDPVILKALPDVPVEAQRRLDAENQFFVKVGAEVPGMFRPAFLNAEGFLDWEKPRPGCDTYTASPLADPVISINLGQGNAFGMRSSSNEVVTTITRGDVTSGPQVWRVEPDTPIYITSTAKDAVLRASFNGEGEFLFCHQ